MRKILLSLVFVLAVVTVNAQTTVSKLHDPSSVCILGASQTFGNLAFTTTDFPQGCEITDVNVTIWWAKTDGSCSSYGSGCSFHNETAFTVNGPTASEVLAISG
ncbi:MAG: hypothetical protein JKX84_08065, partial [Flavobacteriales bacterium]|nr:hypothetical protein [Flavobacteriales bacterium]